jgi:hypothetical protein
MSLKDLMDLPEADPLDRVVAAADWLGLDLNSDEFVHKSAASTGQRLLLNMGYVELTKLADDLEDCVKLAFVVEDKFPPHEIIGRMFVPERDRLWGHPGYRKVQVGEIEGTINPADGDPVDALTFSIGVRGRVTKILAIGRKKGGNDKYVIEVNGIPAPKDWKKHIAANARYGWKLDMGKVKGKEDHKRDANYTTGEVDLILKDLTVAAKPMQQEKRAFWMDIAEAGEDMEKVAESRMEKIKKRRGDTDTFDVVVDVPKGGPKSLRDIKTYITKKTAAEVPTVIAPSPIHGVGVFARTDMPRGAKAGLAVDAPFIPDELKEDARTELGRSINHSDSPNTWMNIDGELYTVDPVSAGDELTLDYTAPEVVGWTAKDKLDFEPKTASIFGQEVPVLGFDFEKIAARRREDAKGIPDRKRFAKIPDVSDATWEFTHQRHHARRAGTHSDIRLSDGVDAHSWATRKGLPAPGVAHEAYMQPTHSPGYMRFKGSIPEGYGAGTVELADNAPVKIEHASDDQVHFVLMHKKNPQTFLLTRGTKAVHKKKRLWWLINTTPTEKSRPHVPGTKVPMTTAAKEQVDKYLGPEYAMRAKIDGSHGLVHIKENKVELFSHRRQEGGSSLINHSHITDLGAPDDPSLAGTVMRAEVYAVDKDHKAVSASDVAGLLNNTPANAQKKLKEQGLKLKVALLYPHRWKDGNVWKTGDSATYAEKKKVLDRVVSNLREDIFHLPHEEREAGAKRRMMDAIVGGDHPETNEGVVVDHVDVAKKPIKIPLVNRRDVYVRGVEEGEGMHTGMASALLFSHEPDGKIVGRFSPGKLSHKERRELWEHRDSYSGRKAVVVDKGQFSSGALRGAQFSHWHM